MVVASEKPKPKVKVTKPKLSKHQEFQLRWTQLESEYGSWRPHYQEISTFLLPRNGRFFVQDRNKGGRRHNSILDNSGTRALRTCGSGLMAGATSPARPWLRVLTSDPRLNRQYAIRSWLDEVTRLILQVFNKSNTYRVLHMMYEELAAFGTAACLVLEDFENVIHLHPLTCGEYRLATDYKGNVNTCYRRFEKTVVEVVNEFGYDNCSTSVKEAYDNGMLGNTVTVMHVIEPRSDRDPSKSDAKNMPWRSIYYEENRDEGKFLREGGFESFPVLAPRWAVVGGDVYGHGPGMEALGDIKQLQHEQLRKSQGIDFKTLPPMLMPMEAKGQENRWTPGGITFVNSLTSTTGIKTAFEVTLDLADLREDMLDVRERIRGSFFADLFLMLSLAGTNTRMTATEVAERHEEKLIQLGPVLERLHTELLEPLVRKTFDILAAAGALPVAPPELQGRELNIEFISMLAQAQRAIGVAGIERALNIALGLQQSKPAIMDNIDEDELWSEITDMIGVTPRITRPPEARNQMRRATAEAQKAQAQAAMLESTSSSVNKLANAPTDRNNALSDVISLFSGYNQPPAQSYGGGR